MKTKKQKRNPYQKRKHIVKRKTKKVKKIRTESGNKALPKRPRGRPRKDSLPLNDIDKDIVITGTGKKRGRPRKVFNTEYKKEDPILPTKPMKTLKFAGYCPACQLTLTTQDVIDGIFTCYKCNKSGKESELLPTIPKRETAKSKKEYLQTVNSTTYDDVEHYHAPAKEAAVEKKEDIETIEELAETDDLGIPTESTEPIDPIDHTEEIGLEDEQVEQIEQIEPTIIKTDAEIEIEKKFKDFLDKNEDEE